mmetsp:Transcript_99286/g.263872  ORF Transcript_99286/g.263872 Transcript_99286/m.263872 type:complete len:255 (-) Transcript_99286:125-889(-)
MVGSGLPGHLASLLRHKPKEQPRADGGEEEAAAPQDSGAQDERKARRRAAVREKKRAAKAEYRSKLQADRKAAKEKAKAAAAAAAEAEAKAAAAAEAEVKRSVEEAASKRDATKRAATKRKAGKLKRRPKLAAAGGGPRGLFDPDGAERDEQLLKALEAKLGIAGDPEKRKRAERSIFADLGFEDDLADGIEELPSEEEEEQPGGGAYPDNQHLSELLEGILGLSASSQGAAEAKGGGRKLKVRKKLKSAKADG